jgi:hypothetical protein
VAQWPVAQFAVRNQASILAKMILGYHAIFPLVPDTEAVATLTQLQRAPPDIIADLQHLEFMRVECEEDLKRAVALVEHIYRRLPPLAQADFLRGSHDTMEGHIALVKAADWLPLSRAMNVRNPKDSVWEFGDAQRSADSRGTLIAAAETSLHEI